MKNLMFWVAMFCLLPQALYVRKNAPRFASAAGPLEGSVGRGKPVRLLAIGDSIIAGVGASQLSKAMVGQTSAALAESLNSCVSWQTLGVSGYDSKKICERLVPKLPDTSFDYIIVSVGVNDVTGLMTIREWQRNLAQLQNELQTHSPNATIAFAGVPPIHGFPLLPQPLRAVLGMRARTFDKMMKQVLDTFPNAMHVPFDFEPDPSMFSADGYHPSEASYVKFGRHMADGLLNQH